jgi:hypothetical protein
MYGELMSNDYDSTIDDLKRHGFRMPSVNAGVDKPYGEYLPKQVEHCLRLTLERLQNGLRKSNDKPLATVEIQQLATAAHALYSIYAEL